MSQEGLKPTNFFKKSLVGGLVVLLPLAILAVVFKWVYGVATQFTSPIAKMLITRFEWSTFTADLLGVVALVVFCFITGNFVTTKLGGWVWGWTEHRIMSRLPGYRPIREIIAQFLGSGEDSVFSRGEVVRVWVYGKDVDCSMLGIITARHKDGNFAVFVPTGPNPTNGFIYLVNENLVTHHPEIKVEQFMKLVVACGAGTQQWFGHLPEHERPQKIKEI
ncbi:MAG TPA: DUF502 domain-containing protein [Alcanivoracaceae bacterium]|nr:DUF502 domain-containing protein [Alcanivoracaceae bacterium]